MGQEKISLFPDNSRQILTEGNNFASPQQHGELRCLAYTSCETAVPFQSQDMFKGELYFPTYDLIKV